MKSLKKYIKFYEIIWSCFEIIEKLNWEAVLKSYKRSGIHIKSKEIIKKTESRMESWEALLKS